jgi:transcriptional regulator with XRE-family HTH domain
MAKTVDDLEEAQRERFREVLKALATRVRSLRLAAGLSGRRFASAAGLAHANLVAIESGTTNVTLLNIFTMAEALGVEMRVLLQDLTPAKSSVDPILAKLVGELSQANKQLDLRRDAIAVIVDELQDYMRERNAPDVTPAPRYIKKH